MFFGHCHRTRFRDSFCLASEFEMTVYLLTYLLTVYVTLCYTAYLFIESRCQATMRRYWLKNGRRNGVISSTRGGFS